MKSAVLERRGDAIDLKREALAQVFPEVLAPPKGGAFVFRGNDVTGWLRRL